MQDSVPRIDSTPLLLPEPGWAQAALCAQTDPEVFFPDKGDSSRATKAVCRGCPVRGECLETALANDEWFGVWGGLSEQERRQLVKHRAAVALAAPAGEPAESGRSGGVVA